MTRRAPIEHTSISAARIFYALRRAGVDHDLAHALSSRTIRDRTTTPQSAMLVKCAA